MLGATYDYTHRLIRFERESFQGKRCRLCGSTNTYLDEMFDAETGEKFYQCSDTSYCQEVRAHEA